MADHLPYLVEYAKKPGTYELASCRICEQYIPVGSLRISTVVKHPFSVTKMDYHWHHEDCFFKRYSPKATSQMAKFESLRSIHQKRIKAKIKRKSLELQFFDDGTNIPGVSSLSKEDQDAVKKALPKIEKENIPATTERTKLEPKEEKDEKDLDNQQETFFFIRDNLDWATSYELTQMLKANDQEVPKSKDDIIDALSDAVMFGALEPCPKCGGQFAFKPDGTGYRCSDAHPWASCGNFVQYPNRKKFVIPKYPKFLKEKYFKHEIGPSGNRLLRNALPAIGKIVNVKDVSKTEDKNKCVKSRKKILYVKGGVTVPSASGLGDVAHVYQHRNTKYTATLVKVHTQTKTNNYYNMQILEHDKEAKYWLFREWGRIGTGSSKRIRKEATLEKCIDKFESLFKKRTGNQWQGHTKYPKKHGMYYPIFDSDDADVEKLVGLLSWKIESKLTKEPVRDLVRLSFASELLKTTVFEYEINMGKMPLGKIPGTRIQQALFVLWNVYKDYRHKNKTKLTAACNEFYTLIPHIFDGDGPSNFKNAEEIKRKMEMLISLSKKEIEYTLKKNDTAANENPLDVHYKQLNANIDVLDPESAEFKLIEKYVENTHAEEHKNFNIFIKEVFTVKRDDEEKRFEQFKELKRKLLWHGSHVTNFAGILSQGLRIAPTDGPVTGHWYGEGIYFADMVSNATYYCKRSYKSTGLLLLCDVALGNMYEQSKAGDFKKLPDNCHSTWARGKTQPDPEKCIKLKTGVEVPCGPEIPAKTGKFMPNHNQFIVYKEAQVKLMFIVAFTAEF